MTWNSAADRRTREDAQKAFLALPKAEQEKITWDDAWKYAVPVPDTLEIATWQNWVDWAERKGKTPGSTLRWYLELEKEVG